MVTLSFVRSVLIDHSLSLGDRRCRPRRRMPVPRTFNSGNSYSKVTPGPSSERGLCCANPPYRHTVPRSSRGHVLVTQGPLFPHLLFNTLVLVLKVVSCVWISFTGAVGMISSAGLVQVNRWQRSFQTSMPGWLW